MSAQKPINESKGSFSVPSNSLPPPPPPRPPAKPIRPDQVTEKKTSLLPNGVIEAFNEMIAENWNGHSATFTFKEVTERIKLRIGWRLVRPTEPFDSNYLNVQDIYKKEGWIVTTDSPGYNESYYDPRFIFKKPAGFS